MARNSEHAGQAMQYRHGASRRKKNRAEKPKHLWFCGDRFCSLLIHLPPLRCVALRRKNSQLGSRRRPADSLAYLVSSRKLQSFQEQGSNSRGSHSIADKEDEEAKEQTRDRKGLPETLVIIELGERDGVGAGALAAQHRDRRQGLLPFLLHGDAPLLC